jgi:hypothetical protein
MPWSLMVMHANHDNPTNRSSSEKEELLQPAESPLRATCEILPGIAVSQAAFRRALPDLLKQRPGRWVAYHGDECLGFARSETALYEQCIRNGLKDDEFVVRRIMEEIPPDADCTPPFDV